MCEIMKALPAAHRDKRNSEILKPMTNELVPITFANHIHVMGGLKWGRLRASNANEDLVRHLVHHLCIHHAEGELV